MCPLEALINARSSILVAVAAATSAPNPFAGPQGKAQTIYEHSLNPDPDPDPDPWRPELQRVQSAAWATHDKAHEIYVCQRRAGGMPGEDPTADWSASLSRFPFAYLDNVRSHCPHSWYA